MTDWREELSKVGLLPSTEAEVQFIIKETLKELREEVTKLGGYSNFKKEVFDIIDKRL